MSFISPKNVQKPEEIEEKKANTPSSSSSESISSCKEVLQLSPTPEMKRRKDISPTPSFETSFHEAIPRQVPATSYISKRSSIISQTTEGQN